MQAVCHRECVLYKKLCLAMFIMHTGYGICTWYLSVRGILDPAAGSCLPT